MSVWPLLISLPVHHQQRLFTGDGMNEDILVFGIKALNRAGLRMGHFANKQTDLLRASTRAQDKK